MADVNIWFPYYLGEQMREARRLTYAQKGPYIELLSYFWEFGPIPNSPSEIAIIAGVPVSEWDKAFSSPIMALFEQDVDGNWVHLRLMRLKAEAQFNAGRVSAAGRKAAAARWNRDAPTKPSDMQSHSDGNAIALRPDMRSVCPSTAPLPSPPTSKLTQPETPQTTGLKSVPRENSPWVDESCRPPTDEEIRQFEAAMKAGLV